jgi:glycine/D-amino acid oxidase-like deaminating enzyme
MSELPRQADRSWWLEQALADPTLAAEDTPALVGDTTADVVIIGGGYTGMWSAYFLKEREPDLDVVLLEQDVCGGGPSGRNGGFLNGLYDEMPLLIRRFGDEGRRTVELAARSIDEIGEWAARHALDIGYVRAGNLGISTSAAQDETVEEVLEDARRLDIDDVYRRIDADALRERFDSPVGRGGVEVTHAAGVQPGRLARALRRVCLQRGVRIFEDTPVTRFSARPNVLAETPGGTVRARRAILGVNAWAVAWREFHRRVMVRGTYIVITHPSPEALEATRWTGREGVYDFRTALHYLSPTADGRIAFGGAGLRIAQQRIGPRYRYDERSVLELVADFRRWFPRFADVPMDAAWGGPVDVSGYHLPFFGTLPGGQAHYGLGFTGNGVGPCHLGGKILAGLALDAEDEYTTLPLVGLDSKRFPREPFFRVGERLVAHAVLRKDRLDDEGKRPSAPVRFMAGLPRRIGYNLGP